MKLPVLAAAAALALGAPAAMAQDNGLGVRFSIVGGYFMGHAFDDYDGTTGTTFPIAGPFGGIQFGTDLSLGPVLVGIAYERVWSSVQGEYTSADNEGAFDMHLTQSVLARFGYAFGAWRPYVIGGLSFSRVHVEGGPVGLTPDRDEVVFHSGFRPGYGWNIGLGIEREFSHNILASVEYRFHNVGDEIVPLTPTYSGDHFVAAAGNTIRFGLTYKFGVGP